MLVPGLKIAAARGIGESHSTQGQSQMEAGIVIGMSALSTIHEIDARSAWVDAGVRWIELLQATAPQGKSPPVLTGFIELSISGTLSVGGIGGQAFRWGLQVDDVLELDVVTGRGQLVSRASSRPPRAAGGNTSSRWRSTSLRAPSPMMRGCWRACPTYQAP